MKLIFVYNADSGLVNTLIDVVHKTVSPKTYACNLCGLTYASVSMKKAWKRFISSLDLPVEFLHRDQLSDHYGVEGVDLPAVFLHAEGSTTVWIDAEALNACHTLDELIRLVQGRLAVTPPTT